MRITASEEREKVESPSETQERTEHRGEAEPGAQATIPTAARTQRELQRFEKGSVSGHRGEGASERRRDWGRWAFKVVIAGVKLAQG